jgi:hypothetical protein
VPSNTDIDTLHMMYRQVYHALPAYTVPYSGVFSMAPEYTPNSDLAVLGANFAALGRFFGPAEPTPLAVTSPYGRTNPANISRVLSTPRGRINYILEHPNGPDDQTPF